MSKALIISHAGHGQYVVDVQYDTTYLQQLISKFDEEYLRLLLNDLPDATTANSVEQSALQSAQNAVDVAILTYNADPTEENFHEIERLTLEAVKQSDTYRKAKQALDAIVTRMDAIRRRLDNLRSNDQTRKRDILWCVDLADGKVDRNLFKAGDEVGVIEISGEDTIGQNLLPSYAPGWEYDITTDGFLANINGLTPFEFLYNKVMMPGWQTWKHPYRSGVITGGDPDSGWTITLDNTVSREQSLEINNILPDRELTGVHAQYMSCDDYAFGVNDHVVLNISISGPAIGTVVAPIIVGFVDNPRPCLDSGFAYYQSVPTPAKWRSVSNSTGAWVMKDTYTSDLQADGAGSFLNWIGANDNGEQIALNYRLVDKKIYLSGALVGEMPTDHDWYVLGAGVSPKKKYLYSVVTYGASAQIWVFRKGLQDVVTDWSIDGPIDLGVYAKSSITRAFFFNRSCTRALCMNDYTHGARRTPQTPPYPGSSWSTDLSLYENYWFEKLELTIAAPDAKTLVGAGVSFTNHGVNGHITTKITTKETYTHGYQSCDPLEGNYCFKSQSISYRQDKTRDGKYQITTGFIGDEETPGYIIGEGTQTQTRSATITSSDTSSRVYNSGSVVINGTWGWYYYAPIIGVKVAYNEANYDMSWDWSGPESESSGSVSVTQTFTDGYVGFVDLSMRRLTYNCRVNRVTSGGSSDGTTFTSVDATEVHTEIGQFWCGQLIDTSSVETYNVTTPGSSSSGGAVIITPLVWYFTNYYNTHPQPDVGIDDTESFIDHTGQANIYDPSVIDHGYTQVGGAIDLSGKVCAFAFHDRNPTFTTQSVSFLTGTDLDVLEGLGVNPVYRSTLHVV